LLEFIKLRSFDWLIKGEVMRILVVEDDLKLAALLKKYLQLKKFTVDHISDGRKAEVRAVKTSYDMIMLDWILPTQDGLKTCSNLRLGRYIWFSL